MAATMQQVADAAGVSIATVSFVVNNSKPVTPATRRRIEQAMDKLGYQRNLVARALASRRTRILALAYPTFDYRVGGSLTQFVVATSSAAAQAGYHLVIAPVSNDATELTDLVGQGLVDGVLLMEVQLHDARVDALRQQGTPYSLIGRTADTTGLHYVDIDFDRTMRLAMQHLRTLGHQRIALINGGPDEPSGHDYGVFVRIEAAYRDQVALAGDAPVVVPSTHNVASGRHAVRELLANHPTVTAVIVCDEAGSVGVTIEAGIQGRRIPEDLSILSVLSTREAASLSVPELTIVSVPAPELGRLGVESLIRQLDGPEPLPPQLCTGQFIMGSSTGPPSASVKFG
ncbi:MAG: LacI family DNA-binding transcriptional regulator [Propioniciclava sp.]